ncbi:MAG TPA: hypothetical protein VK604_15530 [Bryobacteraceae bacterium]|nr:hypothetical protein [Bryobacteraceae bacterium]
MNRLGQLGVVWAVFLSLLAPAMACAVPNARMTVEEHACCRQMKGKCESAGMPASHSCCRKDAPANHLDAASFQHATAIPALLPSPVLWIAPSPAFERIAHPKQSLPVSPPAAISVLRI